MSETPGIQWGNNGNAVQSEITVLYLKIWKGEIKIWHNRK